MIAEIIGFSRQAADRFSKRRNIIAGGLAQAAEFHYLSGLIADARGD